MSASNAFEYALARLLFNNVDLAGLGDAGGLRGSVSAGSLYIALHTADPGEAGNQSTSECSYAGYERLAVARSDSGFAVAAGGGSISNVGVLEFATNNSGATVNVTHFSIGLAASGATTILASGPAAFACPNGVAPRFLAGQMQSTID